MTDLGLQIAMHNTMMSKQGERKQDLSSEAAYKHRRKALEAIGFDELVEIDAEQLSRDAEMASEVEVFPDLQDAVFLIWIPSLQVLEDLDLDKSLMMEALLVANDLDSYHVSGFMVPAAQDLPERAFSKRVDHFVTEHDMVTLDDQVVASLIIVAVIIRAILFGRKLFLTALTDKVNMLVLLDFL